MSSGQVHRPSDMHEAAAAAAGNVLANRSLDAQVWYRTMRNAVLSWLSASLRVLSR